VRPLTEDETKVVFEKLHKFIGKNIKALVDQGEQPYCLRLQKNRVFYVREDIMRRATNVSPAPRRIAPPGCSRHV
jgi:60S ribosome subunit biogenesis protein NIP7